MKVKLLTTLTLALPLMASASPMVLAASDEPQTKAETPKDAMQSKESAKDTGATKTMDSSMKNNDNPDMKTASNIEYVTRQQPSEWSAQALIGRDVINTDGEELGEINNVIIDESGKVVAVTVGVGGFLGLGEKDVGVPFDALKFETGTQSTETTQDSDTADQEKAADEQSSGETGNALSDRFEREHPDTKVVLDATRSQLKSAPEFLWLDEQADKRAEAEGTTTAQ